MYAYTHIYTLHVCILPLLNVSCTIGIHSIGSNHDFPLHSFVRDFSRIDARLFKWDLMRYESSIANVATSRIIRNGCSNGNKKHNARMIQDVSNFMLYLNQSSYFYSPLILINFTLIYAFQFYREYFNNIEHYIIVSYKFL